VHTLQADSNSQKNSVASEGVEWNLFPRVETKTLIEVKRIAMASWHQFRADWLTVEIIFIRSLRIHVMCVCKKGFIPCKDLYPLCHFYFSDLQLLIADKLFCNQIADKALWERLYSFHYEHWQTKQTSSSSTTWQSTPGLSATVNTQYVVKLL
jgi:hypothetical protein